MATLIDAFQSWRRELEAVEREMDQLIAAGLPASVEDRQARQARFATLVERREAAARKLLQSDWPGRRNKTASPEPHLTSATQGGAEAGLPSSALPTDLVPLAPDVVVLPSISALVLSASAPADADTCPDDVVAAPEPADLPTVPASAAVLGAHVPVGATELPTDVVAPDAAASIAVTDFPPATADRTDVAEAVRTESVESGADPVDASATHPESTSSDDPDFSLMTLLRRLQRSSRGTTR
jgi:hypothetical protein